MAMNPEIALLVSTYQRPQHLRRALLSIARQQGVDGQMEVIVTDDGSRDETPQVVRDFARTVDFPVEFTTHPHSTFQLARCRNEGVAASRAPYLLFLDGDCVLPPDHVAIHLAQRRPGVVMAGHFMRIDQTNSAKIDELAIRHGNFSQWISESEKQFVRRLDLKWRFYQWLRHPTKPKLFGNNIGIWRRDYERVNGYDETFEGWGCEDDDLRLRCAAPACELNQSCAGPTPSICGTQANRPSRASGSKAETWRICSARGCSFAVAMDW